MDRRVEGGHKVKDPDAQLLAPEGLSTHMEYHNLSNAENYYLKNIYTKRVWFISSDFSLIIL